MQWHYEPQRWWAAAAATPPTQTTTGLGGATKGRTLRSSEWARSMRCRFHCCNRWKTKPQGECRLTIERKTTGTTIIHAFYFHFKHFTLFHVSTCTSLLFSSWNKSWLYGFAIHSVFIKSTMITTQKESNSISIQTEWILPCIHSRSAIYNRFSTDEWMWSMGECYCGILFAHTDICL